MAMQPISDYRVFPSGLSRPPLECLSLRNTRPYRRGDWSDGVLRKTTIEPRYHILANNAQAIFDIGFFLCSPGREKQGKKREGEASKKSSKEKEMRKSKNPVRLFASLPEFPTLDSRSRAQSSSPIPLDQKRGRILKE